MLFRSISSIEVAKLPLSLRNWDDLIGGASGVQGDRYTEQAGSTAAGRTGGFNVHGVRSLQNNFLLDGLDNNSISENVQELTTQGQEVAAEYYQQGRERVLAWQQQLQTQVHEKPLQTLLMAAGIGLLFGLLRRR